MRPEPEAAGTNSHLGRGCGRSGRRLLRALGHASTDALPRVLVVSFGSSRPASQSASSVRWIRAYEMTLIGSQGASRLYACMATQRASTEIVWKSGPRDPASGEGVSA